MSQREEPADSSSKIESLSALTRRNVEIIAELEREGDAKRTFTDRLADLISRFVGSMIFVYLHVVWFAVWIIMGTAPGLPKWLSVDPFPFTFLTFMVSLEAIFLSTFILIKNHEERLAKRRNHLDLQINLLSEQENSQILKMLAEIQSHLRIERDQQTEILKAAAQPDELVRQIKEVIEAE